MFIFANKDYYSGEWRNGLKNGHGTYVINENNIKLTGNWFEGKLLSGDWKMENGSCYTGEFEHNRPKGNGVWKLANGNKVEGAYDQDIMEKTAEVYLFY